VNNRICNFYMTPQGCVKGVSCDFLHPRPTTGMFGGLEAAIDPRFATGGALSGVSGGGPKKDKACDFFNTPRGCVKGDSCDFTHARGASALQSPFAPNPYALALGFGGLSGFPGGLGNPALGALGFQGLGVPPLAGGRGRGGLKPKKCDFFSTPKGCVKGDQCDFIHTKNRPCEFYSQTRGCRKGDLCDFQHVPKDGEASTETSGETTGKTKTSHTSGNRYQPY